MIIFHGSTDTVKKPEIRKEKFNKDFYFGFYCTVLEEQAIRWATRFGDGIVNCYEYIPDRSLKILKFKEMSDEWLDFIASCRNGQPHDYDIVEGPMADDTVYNFVQGYLDGKYSRETFWSLAKFKHPTHQICFNTERALKTLIFKEAKKVYEEK